MSKLERTNQPEQCEPNGGALEKFQAAAQFPGGSCESYQAIAKRTAEQVAKGNLPLVSIDDPHDCKPSSPLKPQDKQPQELSNDNRQPHIQGPNDKVEQHDLANGAPGNQKSPGDEQLGNTKKGDQPGNTMKGDQPGNTGDRLTPNHQPDTQNKFQLPPNYNLRLENRGVMHNA
jgi:hypothetical protein